VLNAANYNCPGALAPAKNFDGGNNMFRIIFLIGCIGAAVLSWIANHSVVWAILHFFCNWVYVIYWFLVKTKLRLS